LITEAELHLLDFFQENVHGRFPDHQMFKNDSLETEYTHGGKRYLWIFDPMDGADNFQTGIPIWGMSIALMENFWPIFGLFYMPATGDLFYAAAGQEAFRDTEQIRVSSDENVDDESLLLTYSRFHHQYSAGFSGKVRNFGCTAAHICYVAMGRADAAIIANESFQDLAAARVIIESAGGKIFRLNGEEVGLNEYLNGEKIGEPMLVASPGKLSAVRQCLTRSG
jgi:myo-inositol-1(or 4)-monophosphatase